jgi:hypothetical protein
MKAGERVLLPKVRDAEKDTLIISNGFSCREQIAQGTERKALHLAEILHLAIHRRLEDKNGQTPEAYYKQQFGQEKKEKTISANSILTVAGAVLMITGTLLWQQRNR